MPFSNLLTLLQWNRVMFLFWATWSQFKSSFSMLSRTGCLSSCVFGGTFFKSHEIRHSPFNINGYLLKFFYCSFSDCVELLRWTVGRGKRVATPFHQHCSSNLVVSCDLLWLLQWHQGYFLTVTVTDLAVVNLQQNRKRIHLHAEIF